MIVKMLKFAEGERERVKKRDRKRDTEIQRYIEEE